MDQIKIGRFISERRRQAGLTQMQLAEKLNVTDRAVSKWETGKSMPDSSIMLELCDVLKITVNDLLCGEVVSMGNYDEKMEKNLLEMVKEKERSDRRLLNMEIVVVCLAMALMFTFIAIASFVSLPDWSRILLIVAGFVILLVVIGFAIRIEQIAGYYQCAKCGHRYIPKYGSVLGAMHMGRTRYMKCPNCGKRSWQKKVLNKE